MQDRVLILDFGAQTTQLIARRVREAGVYCEILPYNTDPETLKAFGARAIILSGGPASVVGADTPSAPAMVFEANVPVLGICYGEHNCLRLRACDRATQRILTGPSSPAKLYLCPDCKNLNSPNMVALCPGNVQTN